MRGQRKKDQFNPKEAPDLKQSKPGSGRKPGGAPMRLPSPADEAEVERTVERFMGVMRPPTSRTANPYRVRRWVDFEARTLAMLDKLVGRLLTRNTRSAIIAYLLEPYVEALRLAEENGSSTLDIVASIPLKEVKNGGETEAPADRDGL